MLSLLLDYVKLYSITTQHKCTYPKHYWTQVGATRLSAEICGYSSYTNVQCEVLAHNDAGDGDVIESNAIRTSCTGTVY